MEAWLLDLGKQAPALAVLVVLLIRLSNSVEKTADKLLDIVQKNTAAMAEANQTLRDVREELEHVRRARERQA